MASVVTARMRGRRRQAEAVIGSVTGWAATQPDVEALALVGSYAYDRPTMASDVDLVLLVTDVDRHTSGIAWIRDVDPRAALIRTQRWGPLTERRVRLRSGLQVELGVTDPTWAAVPLDAGTARVLSDGCQVLYDPGHVLGRAIDAL